MVLRSSGRSPPLRLPGLRGLQRARDPTVIQFASDGRVFVAEKSGLIKVFDSLVEHDADGLRRPAHERLQLRQEWAPRHGARPELSGDALRVRALHLRRTDRRDRPGWGVPGASADSCPRERRRVPGQRAAVASPGERERDDRRRAGAGRGLVPAVSGPARRQPRVRPRRRPLCERRGRSQLHVRGLTARPTARVPTHRTKAARCAARICALRRTRWPSADPSSASIRTRASRSRRRPRCS